MAGKIGWVIVRALASVWFFVMIAITILAVISPLLVVVIALSFAGYHWTRHLIDTFAPEDEEGFLTY